MPKGSFVLCGGRLNTRMKTRYRNKLLETVLDLDDIEADQPIEDPAKVKPQDEYDVDETIRQIEAILARLPE